MFFKADRGYFTILAMAVFLLLLSGCKSDHEQGEKAKELPTVAVKTSQVKEIDASYQVEIMGTVGAVDSAVVATKVSGNITNLPVAIGSHVEKGDILAELDAGELSARLDQARAQLNQATRNLKREKELLSKKASTPETVKNMQDALRIAQAGLQEAETMIDYTKIRAPFSGTITNKYVNTGDLITPGKPLLQIENATNLQVLTHIPESLLITIHADSELNVRIPSLDQPLKAQVKEIAPTINPDTRSALVKLSLPENNTLRPGNFVRVAIPKQAEKTLVIPESGLFRTGQLEQVFVIKNDKALIRLVRSGMKVNGEVEILSGLEKEEIVITDPSGRLENNQPVSYK